MNDGVMSNKWTTTTRLSDEDLEWLRNAESLAVFEEQLSTLKEKVKKLKTIVTAGMPVDFGVVEKEVGSTKVVVERSENFKWDQKLLAQQLNDTDILPNYIEKKLVVQKSVYNTLAPEDQDILNPALTRAPGPAKVTVEL